MFLVICYICMHTLNSDKKNPQHKNRETLSSVRNVIPPFVFSRAGPHGYKNLARPSPLKLQFLCTESSVCVTYI